VTEERLEDLQGNIFSCTKRDYDDRGNVTRLQEGESVTYRVYDSQNRPTEIIDPLGYKTKIVYNESFRNIQEQQVIQMIETDPLGNQTFTTYDTLKRVASVIKKDPFGKTIFHQEIDYNGEGNPCVVTDYRLVDGETRRKITTLKEYNLNNQLEAQTEALDTPEQKIIRYTYNEKGELEKISKNDGVVLTHTYDALGRLSRVLSSDAKLSFEYTYNHQDLVTSSSDGTLTTRRKYDPYGNLIQETLANGIDMIYTYDLIDRPLTVNFLDKTVSYTYDPFALTSVETDAGSHEIIKRNLFGDPLVVKLMNGTEVVYTYDLAGQCASIEHPSFIQIAAYDPLGNLLASILNREEKKYAYDALSQMITDSHYTYQYDSLGNRIQSNGTTTDFNALNQVSEKGYTYDRSGNLVQDPEITYAYDALDRLIAVKTPLASIVYQYDTFGRRVSQTVNGRTIHYLYQGEDEIGAYEDGNLIEWRVLGERSRAVGIELPKGFCVPLYDLCNNVAGLLDGSGKLIEQYDYNAFAEERALDTQNPWRYAGKRTDPETGLVYFGKRYYSPVLGRWITADPLGFADGPNLYAYVHNNPLRYYDAQGFFASKLAGFALNSLINNSLFSNRTPNVSYFDSFEKLQPWCSESKVYEMGLPDKPGKGIFFINGALTNEAALKDHMGYLSKMSDNGNIHAVHNATHHVMDFPEAALGLMYIATSPVQLLHQGWDQFFNSNARDSTILHYCQSQGAIHTRNALLSYNEERRQRISVVAIAPAAYIYENTCRSVVHYRAEPWRDPIPYIDVMGAWRARNTTVTLRSHSNAPKHDHGLQSPTYRKRIREEYDDYSQSKGRYSR
jgi:RHS repeat-associated protein